MEIEGENTYKNNSLSRADMVTRNNTYDDAICHVSLDYRLTTRRQPKSEGKPSVFKKKNLIKNNNLMILIKYYVEKQHKSSSGTSAEGLT